MKYLNQLYQLLVVGKEKAIAGGAVAFVVAFVVQHFGYHVANGLQQVLTSAVLGVLTHLSVYFTNNSKA